MDITRKQYQDEVKQFWSEKCNRLEAKLVELQAETERLKEEMVCSYTKGREDWPRERVEMNEEFIKYIDLISTMCVDCIGGGITEKTYLSNLKLMIPKMSELFADKELGPFDIECGFPKRKDRSMKAYLKDEGE